MTPAITALDSLKADYKLHQYDHDPANRHYGLEAAEKMSVAPERIFKTLVVELDGAKLAVAVLPVGQSLDLKSLARSLGAKKAQMARPDQVERSSGYVLGGVSPIGQKRALPTIVDCSAQACSTIYVSAGKRGLEIELSADLLCQITRGNYAPVGVSR